LSDDATFHEEKEEFVISINPAVAYRWISNMNAYKQAEMLAKERYKVLRQYGIKKDFGDYMKWILLFIFAIIAAYIAIQLFGNHASSQNITHATKSAVNTAKNVTVVKT